MPSELEDLRRRVERLEEMLVLMTAKFEDNLDLNALRNEDIRNRHALVAEVDARMRAKRRERTPRFCWDGDLEAAKRRVVDRASLVLDHGLLTIVCQGKTFSLAEGDYYEITEDGRVRPCRSPEADQAYEESLHFYREAARR